MEAIKLHSTLAEKYITITWFVSSQCNYKCFYCVDYLNNGVKFPDNYEKPIKFIKQIRNKYPDKIIRLFFMGGEISLWKSFLSFTKEIKKIKNIKIIMISNGSFSVDWIQTNLEYLDFILISYHHQFASKEHFINIGKLINHKGHILLMMPHNKFDEVLEIGKQISKEAKIHVSPKLLRINFKNEYYPYTKNQLEKNKFVGQEYFPSECLTFLKGNPNIIFSDKTKKRFKCLKIVQSGYNKMFNWKCYGGIENFFINENGDLLVGQCRRGLFGNIFNENIILPDDPFICNKETCNCTIDLESCNKNKGVS